MRMMDKIYGRYCCIAIFDKPVDLGLPEIAYSNIIATIAPVDGLWCVFHKRNPSKTRILSHQGIGGGECKMSFRTI